MKDFKSYYTIPADPADVFAAITNSATIELWTGEPSSIHLTEGAEFSMWDGSIVGKIIEFEQDKKMVQQWYFGEQEAPSIVTIKLHIVKNGTSAELRHTNIPDVDYDSMVEGWNEVYFGGLIDFFSM